MAVERAQVKECGAPTRSRRLRLRPVLRPPRGGLRPVRARPGDAKRHIQADPRASGATRTSCRSTADPASTLEPGLTPLIRADRLAERLGLGELWIKNDAANPTHSFKDRVVAVALAKARELGFDTVACASTGNLANAVAAHAAAAGARLLRLRAGGPRGAEAPRQRRLRDQLVGVRRQLRRRQPALHGARRGPALGVRQRQPAPLLRRGLEDARLRDRRAARLALPDRVVCPIASGSLFTKIARGSASGSSSAWSRASCPPSTAPRPAVQPGRDRVHRRPGGLQAAARPTIAKSLAIGDPADGLYALELARRTGGRSTR